MSLTNYATQGGFAGNCGISLAPAAVAINVTSTNQTGPGNLRVIETFGGLPNASLLNYTAGVIVANAAVSRSTGSLGGSNIFILLGRLRLAGRRGHHGLLRRAFPDTHDVGRRGRRRNSCARISRGVIGQHISRRLPSDLRPERNCLRVHRVDRPAGNSGVATQGQISVVGRSGNPNGVFIQTTDNAGTVSVRPFHLHVMC